MRGIKVSQRVAWIGAVAVFIVAVGVALAIAFSGGNGGQPSGPSADVALCQNAHGLYEAEMGNDMPAGISQTLTDDLVAADTDASEGNLPDFTSEVDAIAAYCKSIGARPALGG
jgi:hypothetical protein